ncbi:hypothetical protein D3C87_143740 [compost metagenome]
MRSSFTALTQSKFYSPALNSAIYDGPVRIYFAQFHEALALKIYFMIQQGLTQEMQKAKEISKATGANILVMIYPTAESFSMSFEGAQSHNSPLEVEKFDQDVVIGLRGPIEDENLELLMETLKVSMDSWRPVVAESNPRPVEL